MRVVGIDLAASPKRPTGICVLEDLRARPLSVFSDEEIVELVAEAKPVLVAIDAPLTLPKPGKSLRACDLDLMRRGLKPLPPLMGPMRGLTARALRLKERISSLNIEVIEVFPKGARVVLSLPRRGHGPSVTSLLTSMGISLLRPPSSDHEVDAVVAAYVAALYLKGDYETCGDPDEGVIVMPKAGVDSRWRSSSR